MFELDLKRENLLAMADLDTIWVIRPSMDIHSELKWLCADRVGVVS